MCVIFIVDKNRPNQEMIEAAYAGNPDGAGAAWREPARKGGGKEVVWKKDLEVEKVIELAQSLPLPYILHFRVASIGGIRPSLTHPFEISNTCTGALEGRTTNAVLFHNGHWTDWAGAARQAAIATRTLIPAGRWNDSRAMAWLCSIYGLGFMELLPEQRGVALGPETLDVFTGPGWTQVDYGTGKIWCSNDHFKFRNQKLAPYCRAPHCLRRDCDATGLCVEHRPLAPTTSGKSAASPAGTGGAQSAAPLALRPVAILTTAEVEVLYKAGKVSKGRLKAVRKLYDKIGKGGNRAERARLALKHISMEIASSNGSVH